MLRRHVRLFLSHSNSYTHPVCLSSQRHQKRDNQGLVPPQSSRSEWQPLAPPGDSVISQHGPSRVSWTADEYPGMQWQGSPGTGGWGSGGGGGNVAVWRDENRTSGRGWTRRWCLLGQLFATQRALAPCTEEVTDAGLGLEGKLPASTASMRARVPLPHRSTQRPTSRARTHVPTLARAGHSPTQQRPAGSRARCPRPPPREPIVPSM